MTLCKKFDSHGQACSDKWPSHIRERRAVLSGYSKKFTYYTLLITFLKSDAVHYLITWLHYS